MCSHALLYPAQHDPISEMLQTHFPTATRKTLPSVESVSMDMAGLRRLVVSPCNYIHVHSLIHWQLSLLSTSVSVCEVGSMSLSMSLIAHRMEGDGDSLSQPTCTAHTSYIDGCCKVRFSFKKGACMKPWPCMQCYF